MKNVKNRLVGVGVVAALSVGAGIVPAITSPSPSPTSTSATSSLSSVGSGASSISSSAGAVSSGLSGSASTSTSTNQQAGAAARALVEAIKRFGPAAYNAMVNAVKAGYTAFTNWVKTIPAWVQGVIGSVSASALYDAIKALLGL